MENEAFEKIIRSLVIEESKKKKDVKKKTKKIKQLKNKNEQARKMVDDVKHRHEEAARANEIELKKQTQQFLR